MKKISVIFIITGLLIIACSDKEEPAEEEPSEATGAERDEYGCIPSAGYQWCAKTEQCERPWKLAEANGFEINEEAFNEFCENNDSD